MERNRITATIGSVNLLHASYSVDSDANTNRPSADVKKVTPTTNHKPEARPQTNPSTTLSTGFGCVLCKEKRKTA